MRNAQDAFATRERSIISASSVYMTVPLTCKWHREYING